MKEIKIKEIDLLLRDEKNEEVKVILRSIKHLNNDAYRCMMGEYQVFGPKYHNLQKMDIWKKGKQLNIQYRIFKNELNCPICNTKLNFTRCTMHHILPYDTLELFTPTKVQLIHSHCHQDFHKK